MNRSGIMSGIGIRSTEHDSYATLKPKPNMTSGDIEPSEPAALDQNADFQAAISVLHQDLMAMNI